MKRWDRAAGLGLLAVVALLGRVQAGGAGGPGWWPLDGGGSPQGGPAHRSCSPLPLPAGWDVRSAVWADVTGDGQPECVLDLWRPWRDWPIHRWGVAPTPIRANRDAQGDSAHVALVRPLPGGGVQNLWVGSALFQPVSALTVDAQGRLLTLETTYRAGRSAPSRTLSVWSWTGFGFRLEERRTLPRPATALTTDAGGRVWLR